MSLLGVTAKIGVTRAPAFFPSVPNIVIFHVTWKKSLEPSVNTAVLYQALSTSFLCKFSQKLFCCQDSKAGISLVVQWLRLHHPVQCVGLDPKSGSKDPTCLIVKKSKHKTEIILSHIQ